MANPIAIIIHCNGQGGEQKLEEFARQALDLAPKDFITINVRGGPVMLARRKCPPGDKPREADELMASIVSQVRKHHDSVKRVIVIGHKDCDCQKTSQCPSENLQLQTARLTVRNLLDRTGLIYGITVEAYWRP